MHSIQKIFTTFFLLFSPFIIFGQIWELQNPKPTSNRLSEICFIDDTTGWIAGEKGTILKTTDGGQNWELQNSGTDKWLWSVCFTDRDNGWAGGNGAVLLYTQNGGETWTRIPNAPWHATFINIFVKEPDTLWLAGLNGDFWGCFNYGETWSQFDKSDATDRYMHYNKIWFINDKRGYVYGGDINALTFYGKFTDDFGMSWSYQHGLDELSYVTDVFMVDDVVGYLSCDKYGAYTPVYRTMDGGDTWQYLCNPSCNAFSDLYFYNYQIGWGLEHKFVWLTTDGGISWMNTEPFTDDHFSFQDIVFTNDTVGYICSAKGLIGKSIDGGENWEKVSHGFYQNLKSCSFIDDETAWIVGNSIYGSPVIKTENGGELWSIDTVLYENLWQVFFVNNDYGWIVSYPDKIFRTVNGGENWVSYLFGSNFYPGKVFFTDTLMGWCISLSSSNEIAKTVDGGKSWEIIQLYFDFIFNDILFNDTEGWGAGIWMDNVAAIIHTVDGGYNWEVQYSGFGSEGLIDIDRLETGQLFVTDGNGWVYKSNDNGYTWETVKEDEYGFIYEFFPVNEQSFYAIKSEQVIFTEDGGQNWSVIESPVRKTLTDLFFTETMGWVIGGAGTILKLNTLYLSNSNNLQNDIFTVDVFPNPGNRFLYVECLAEKGELLLYNSLGIMAKHHHLIKGINKIDISLLKQGSYIYQVISGNNIIDTGKWIKY